MHAPVLAHPKWLDRRDAWVCALLVTVALATRAVGLNSGLWLDEINGLIDWMRPSFTEILTVWKGDGQHPFYALLAHASLVLFGEHPWSVRLPAALFGVATVPLLYVLARQLGSRTEAGLAAGLLAVSYHHVWFSQNARGYTALTFFVLLATYCIVRALADWRMRWFLAWGVAIALGGYTHLTTVFPAAAHAIVIALLALGRTPDGARRDGRIALAGFGVAAGLTLLLYTPILDQVVWWFLNRPSNFEGISTPGWAAGEALRMLRRGVVGGAGALAGVVALAAATVLMAAGALAWARQSRAVLALFVLPALVTFAGALVVRGTMYPRFFFYVLPYVVLIAVRGALRLPALFMSGERAGPGSVAARAGTAIAALMIVASALSLPYNYRYPKQDFAGALEYLDARRQPDEPVLLIGATVGPYRNYFARDWPELTSAAGLDSAAAAGSGYWLLYTLPRYIEAGTPDLMAGLRRVCPAPEIFRGTVGGGDVMVCHVPAGSGPS